MAQGSERAAILRDDALPLCISASLRTRAGDFFAHRACAETLERTLIGVSPTPELVGRAVDTAYAKPEHDFEGVRNLKSLQEAILDAADLAKRSLDVQ